MRIDPQWLAHRSILAAMPSIIPPGAAATSRDAPLQLTSLRRIGATQTAVLSLCEPLAATLLAAVMFGQLLAPSQLLGGALLLGAGIAVQAVPARPARRSAGAVEPVRDAAGQGWQRQ
jgi:drug/metabolite transporter (DMT)-like permease